MESVIRCAEFRRRAFVAILAATAALFLAVAPSRAEVAFNWGSPVFSTFRDSYGNPLDAGYTFQLGAFDPSFTPTAGNVTLWSANWKVFDQAGFNVPAETFSNTANMLDDGTSSSAFATAGYDFRGLDAYIWGYKDAGVYGDGMEWVWFRAPAWTFPTTFAPGPPVTPTEWSTSDLIAGDVPLWGRQSTAVGLGYASAPGTAGDYTLQTYTIPEPSTSVLLVGAAMALFALGAWRRRKTSRSAALLAAALLAASAGVASANRINFYSSPGQPAYGSDGRPLDSEMSFELGVFDGGFVPTATNTAQWASHWVPAQRTKFSSNHNWFTSVFDVTGNAAPFTEGAPAYVWGFNGSEAQGQWILFRSSKWTWPVADDTAPQPLFWSAKDAEVVIVGALPVSGSGVSLRPIAIANSLPPATSWQQWKLDKLAGQSLGNPADDADGDGVSNVLEFVLGTSPTSAADRPANTGTWMQTTASGGKNYLELRVPRRRDRPANITAEISPSLSSWTSGTNATTVVSDTVDALTVRDKTPIGEGGTKRFMRVKISPQ